MSVAEPIADQESCKGIHVSDLVVTQGDFTLSAPAWHVAHGSLVGLVGVNGAGKTTLLRAMCGRIPSVSGDVRFDGVRNRDFGWSLPEMVGLVPDALVGIEDLSLREHLSLLADVCESWDEGYVKTLLSRLDVPLYKRFRTLSRGTRVKANFVMVEGSRPPILILDEPTSGLDPIVRQQLLAILRDIHVEDPARIVVFSTHILEDIVEIATSVSLVRRGKVLSPYDGNDVAAWRTCLPSNRPQLIAELSGQDSFS